MDRLPSSDVRLRDIAEVLMDLEADDLLREEVVRLLEFILRVG